MYPNVVTIYKNTLNSLSNICIGRKILLKIKNYKKLFAMLATHWYLIVKHENAACKLWIP